MQKEAWWVGLIEFLLNILGAIVVILFYILRPVFGFVSTVLSGVYNHFVKFISAAVFLALLAILAHFLK